MTGDQAWQAATTRAAALAIGQWLEGRGRLHQPIQVLTLPELEAMAVAAISRFIRCASERVEAAENDSLRNLLIG